MEFRLDHIIPAPLESVSAGHAVWGREFVFAPGRRYLLEAVSGRGKSTLIHLLHGSRKDYSGTLSINGQACHSWSLDDWTRCRREKISLVFQDLRLFPQLTVRANLEISGRFIKSNSMTRAAEMVRALGMDDWMDRPCGTLSLGQQQRIALVRALCRDFEYVLMDEPFSHLDEENKAKACQLIHDRCTELGAGLILTSLGNSVPLAIDERIDL